MKNILRPEESIRRRCKDWCTLRTQNAQPRAYSRQCACAAKVPLSPRVCKSARSVLEFASSVIAEHACDAKTKRLCQLCLISNCYLQQWFHKRCLC